MEDNAMTAPESPGRKIEMEKMLYLQKKQHKAECSDFFCMIYSCHEDPECNATCCQIWYLQDKYCFGCKLDENDIVIPDPGYKGVNPKPFYVKIEVQQ